MKKFILVSLLMFTVLLAQPPSSQNKNLKFVFEPDSISLNVGESKKMVVRLVDTKGKQVESQFMVRGQRRALAAWHRPTSCARRGASGRHGKRRRGDCCARWFWPRLAGSRTARHTEAYP